LAAGRRPAAGTVHRDAGEQTRAAPSALTAAPGGIRLQLVLSQAGIAARRKAAELIQAGRVRVDGVVIYEPGYRVDPARQTITYNGEPLPRKATRRRTILMNKPVGLLCSADSSQGKTVCDLIADLPERLVPVGRLDRDSGGLLLLSNDGNLIAHLTHPRHGHRKTYRVEVVGPCNAATLARLRSPMEIDGYTLRPVEVSLLRKQAGHTWLRFVLHEGRNRQIRKMCAHVGLNVVSLMRIAIDNLLLPDDLAPGCWRDLGAQEIRALLATSATARTTTTDTRTTSAGRPVGTDGSLPVKRG
jgi:23S rRNA pseudouridine2605 synthase